MTVQSMTGFARHEMVTGEGDVVWELRSVNGKALDLRFRLPSGLETMDVELRKRASERLSRGNIQASLQFRRQAGGMAVSFNEPLLRGVLALADRLEAEGQVGKPTIDTLLSIKGMIEVHEEPAGHDGVEQRKLIADGFSAALDRLIAARETEGGALRDVLLERLDQIATLTEEAERDPSRSAEAIRARIARQLHDLGETDGRLDPSRLHAEAMLLATRADIREEIDRLRAHVASARKLLVDGGAIGRRLDFLAQEFNRESNTVCSKSNALSMTEIGLQLKITIDQFREQVQNLE